MNRAWRDAQRAAAERSPEAAARARGSAWEDRRARAAPERSDRAAL